MKGTVIILSVVHWHFTWQSVHNVASGLAGRGFRVLFVEPLPKRWPRLNEMQRVWGRLSGHSESAGMCVQPLVDGVELISPKLLPDVGSMAQSINRRLIRSIAADIKSRISEDPIIVINYLPISASINLMEALGPNASFYHCVHDWEHDPYAQGELAERQLARSVDMVWADSPVNYERTAPMQDHVVRLTKGVDTELFAQARRAATPHPPDYRPRCAFFGTLSVSTDLDLLRLVSHHFPLRLIGPIRRDLTGFSSDVEIVGAIPHQEVPSYLKDADVLLLPYDRTSPHVAGILPAKLFECLATGKPGIVSGLTSLGSLQDLFYVVQNSDEFLRAIEMAVLEPTERAVARINCAEENSYDRRIDEIEAYFSQVLYGKESLQTIAVTDLATQH